MITAGLVPFSDFSLDDPRNELKPNPVPLDAYRRDGVYTLLFDLPGVDPNSLDVTIEAGVLTVTADRTTEESEEIEWVMRERDIRCSRRVFLDEDVDVDAVQAVYGDTGVLEVTIPIRDNALPRRLEVVEEAKKIGPARAA